MSVQMCVCVDTCIKAAASHSVERFDFEACLRVSEFRFTRGSA
jgi:hypothetical protein